MAWAWVWHFDSKYGNNGGLETGMYLRKHLTNDFETGITVIVQKIKQYLRNFRFSIGQFKKWVRTPSQETDFHETWNKAIK